MIRDKIRQIKFSRLSEEEKFFYNIFSNLEEIKLKDKWTTTVFYKYNNELIILKKLNENLIYIDDKIFYKFLTKDIEYCYNHIYYIVMSDIIKDIMKEYLNWDEEVKTIEHYHLFMINEEI